LPIVYHNTVIKFSPMQFIALLMPPMLQSSPI
jgi:hypothetical protein